jgi:hypothetical protein
MAIALLSASLLCCGGLASAATLVFADDFDSGTWSSAWALDTGYASWPNVVSSALDGGPGPKSGTKMLALNWNGNVAWNDPRNRSGLVLPNWNYAKEFFVRFWIRVDKDFGAQGSSFYNDPGDGLGTGCKLFRWNDFGSTGDYAVPFMQGGYLHEQWAVDDFTGQGAGTPAGNYIVNVWQSDQNPTDGSRLLDRKWHLIETYVLQDRVNGVVKRWQDGHLQWQFNGKTSNSANAPYYPWYLASNWSTNPGWGHGSNNHIYIDSIQIFSDSNSGVPATGVMSAATIRAQTATTLPPPTNLRVQ